MNNQQNIEDILKLLKSSYNDGDTPNPDVAEDSADKEGALSEAELQERLRKQFMSAEDEKNISDTEVSDEFSYNIDNDFLAESFTEEVSEEEAQIAEDSEVAVEVEEAESTAVVEEEPLELVADAEESAEEEEVLLETEDLDEDGIFVEDENGEIILVSAEKFEGEDAEPVQTEEEVEEAIEITELAEEVAVEEAKTEFFSEEDGQLTLFDNSGAGEEDLPEELETVEEAAETDEDQIVLDFGDPMFDEAEEEIPDEDIFAGLDDSAIDLMFGFGDVSPSVMKNERVSAYLNRTEKQSAEDIDPAEAFAFDGEEYESAEQTDDLLLSYRHEKLMTFIRTAACGVFMTILFFYELFATLSIELDGILSYIEYPSVYALIGLQLFVFSAAFAWRELLGGLKKAFSFKADQWSLVSIVALFVIIHGVAISIIAPDSFKYMFGTVGAAYIFFGLITECLEVCREIKCFSVYSSDKKKFTVSSEGVIGSSAEKMYAGGLSRDKKVFEPVGIEFPKGYFSAVNSEKPSDKLVNYAVAPIIILSTLALLGSTLLGNSADVALGAFMAVLTLLCPISAFAVHTFPMMRATTKLYRRECAVASEAMVEKYAKCDYMVFKDMHLFREAVAQDNGIVIYDADNARRTVEYLGALYSAIGGPMKNVFSEVSGDAHSVCVRRIARNGVEAVIDNSHSLILGDPSFGLRYGIVFPAGEGADDGKGTLVFAVDGRPAAKLRIKYKSTSFFEMIAQRLSENRVKCVIETYDPVINSAFISECRQSKSNPINVVHKNTNDMNSEIELKPDKNTGLVVCSSRFKLAETVIWCKRILSTLKTSAVIQTVMYAILFALVTTAVVLNMSEYFNQYIVMLCQMACVLPVFAVMAIKFPSANYFSEDN
ncbi:MAG: hypothetical protein E7679_04015 [Ruminococcaceae bacterium]|nr:hypothetical protein [Oscillospiraceae bacterium]